MNKRAKIALWFFGIFLLISLILITYLAFAAHVITTVGGATNISFNVNEDVQNWYNITVNNTDTANGNITQVNITLPSGFLFLANSNGSSNGTTGTSARGLFINTNATNTLSWTNATAGSHLIINNTWGYFWFNATASTPGRYNMTVTTTNATGDYQSNLTVTVNDTIAPNMTQFVDPTSASGSNLSLSYIIYNVTATDNGVITNITIRLYNSNRSLINSSNSSTSPLYGNFSGLNEGTYYINASTFDTYNLENSTGSGTRTITLDTTVPVITLISPTNGNNTIQASSVTFIFNVSDSLLTNCSLILNGAIVNFNSSVNITGGNNVFTNLTYSVSNTWNVNCTDSANNKANSSTWSFSVLSFGFNGTTRDENGAVLNNSVINVTIRSQAGWTALAYTSGTSNASGWFNFSIASNSLWMYEPAITHTNSTSSFIDFKSKTIPAFPSLMIEMLAGTTFYLAPAGTINITAINETGSRVLFEYQIKDQLLGYSIADNFNSYTTEAVVYVPKNRNYSIMLYPNQSMPISYNWNNFSSNSSYSFTPGNSSYNHTTSTLHRQFNITMTIAQVTGYITNSSGAIMSNNTIGNWTNFTVIPFLLEAGNMLHSEYGDMPYNLSALKSPPQTDLYNLTAGFFNISLPSTVETSTILLFVSVVHNNSVYYGGFKNISLVYPTTLNNTNITIYGLLGAAGNITMGRVEGGQNIAIPTAKQTFNLVNSTNSTLTSTMAHIETTVDYSAASIGALEFTWMSSIQQSAATATFSLPLLNVTGIKEMNVFAAGGPSGSNGQYAPKKVSTMNAAQIIANNNITINLFSPQGIGETIAAGSLTMNLYTSNSSCDVPNPPNACLLGGSSQTMASFNPMQAVMGGGKISFRMGTGNILVHYVNVDMLASGPPDALFDSNTNTNGTSGSSFEAALRFGSMGPTIYDYVLVSIPYTETAGSGLNDSALVNISIPLLYDDNWNVIWNTTANGTASGALAGNYSHYSSKQSDWGNLTLSGGKRCNTANVTSSAQINATEPCYIDNSSNKIWIRLPHFTGTGPSVSGSVVAAAAGAGTTTTTTGGGGGTTKKEKTHSWTKITPGAATIWHIDDKEYGLKLISVSVKNDANNVKITVVKYDSQPAAVIKNLTGKVYKYLEINTENLADKLANVTINLMINKSWVEANNLTKEKIALYRYDGTDWQALTTVYKDSDVSYYYYDVVLTEFSYFAIGVKPVVVEVTPTPTPTTTTTPPTAAEKPKLLWLWILIIIVVIVAVVIIIITQRKK